MVYTAVHGAAARGLGMSTQSPALSRYQMEYSRV
ncbi:Uncharacterised protein [Vibrio cholerae]|nr:Uncharacterised protein [Vibrio cholerae]